MTFKLLGSVCWCR